VKDIKAESHSAIRRRLSDRHSVRAVSHSDDLCSSPEAHGELTDDRAMMPRFVYSYK